MKTLPALSVLFLYVGVANSFRLQGVAVKGKLLCGREPLENARVRIVDVDTGPDPDDVLDMKFTKNDGTFELDGTTRELTSIDPVLNIYHDCNDAETECQRRVRLTIPKQYIHNGGTNKTWFDAGDLNMEMEFAQEERDCSH